MQEVELQEDRTLSHSRTHQKHSLQTSTTKWSTHSLSLSCQSIEEGTSTCARSGSIRRNAHIYWWQSEMASTWYYWLKTRFRQRFSVPSTVNTSWHMKRQLEAISQPQEQLWSNCHFSSELLRQTSTTGMTITHKPRTTATDRTYDKIMNTHSADIALRKKWLC